MIVEDPRQTIKVPNLIE